MGFCFVLLQRAVQDDPKTSGRKVGALQAANIAGCTAGSLVVGLGSLNWLGTTGTLRGLALCGLVFAGTGWTMSRSRLSFALLGAGLVASSIALPSQEALWLRLHGVPSQAGMAEEDATAVIALTSQPDDEWWMWMGGQSQSSLPFGGTHTWLGALPAIVHPSPEQVAIIGLGSGDTAWASGCRPETRSVTVFELSSPQRRLLERVAVRPGLRHLRRFLDDSRRRKRERVLLGVLPDCGKPLASGRSDVHLGAYPPCVRHLRPSVSPRRGLPRWLDPRRESASDSHRRGSLDRPRGVARRRPEPWRRVTCRKSRRTKTWTRGTSSCVRSWPKWNS